VDDIVVMPRAQTSVDLSYVDLPLSLEGSYGAQLLIDGTVPAHRVSTAISEAGLTVIDDAGGDAALVAHFLERALRDLGKDAEADVLAGLTESLDGALAGDTPSRAVQLLSDLLEQGLARILLLTTHDVNAIDGAGSWAISSLEASSMDGSVTYPVELVGGYPEGRAVFSRVEGTDIANAHLTLPVWLGTLSRSLLAHITAERGAIDSASFLAEATGCASVARWAASDPRLGTECDEPCFLEACHAAAQALADAMENAIASLEAEGLGLDLSGEVQLSEGVSDLTVQGIAGVELRGSWGAVFRDTVTASFLAMRSGLGDPW
jgi:hypothetical protein